MTDPHKPSPAVENVRSPDDVRENKDIAALSYVSVLSVIIFLLRRDSPFVRFHSRQAVILFLISLPLWFIPLVGRFLELFVLAGMVIGFIGAAQGEWNDVAFIGPLSRREMTLREAWRQMVNTVAKLARELGRLVHEDRVGKAKREQYAGKDPAASHQADSSPPTT